MRKIVRLTESDLNRLVRMVIREQSIGAIVTPDFIENYYRKNIRDILSQWVTLDELNELYKLLLPLSGKKVKGVSKCFNQEHQTGGKPLDTSALDYINHLNYWSLQDNCSSKSNQGPSYTSLVNDVKSVGTKTLGKEGDLIKKKIIDLFTKEGVGPIRY